MKSSPARATCSRGAGAVSWCRADICCQIAPKPSLSPAELTALGKTIRHWLRQHDRHGAGSGKNQDGGLSELLDGRPVPSRFNRRVEQVKESKRLRGLYQKVDKGAIRQELIDAGDDPLRKTLRLELFYLHDDRARLIEIARKWIPVELVDDVLVNGQSWLRVNERARLDDTVSE